MEDVLLLNTPPLYHEVIWGDGRLAKRYGCKIKEGANINRIPDGGSWGPDSIIAEGEFAGKTIEWLWINKPEYFGGEDAKKYPDFVPVSMHAAWASADLSVQVHPREDWAMKNLGIHGKSECWYFPECEPNNNVVFGHRAKTMEELDDYLARKDYEGLMIRHPIEPGSFFAIKAGTLHAVQKGSYFIEIDNPCPITYRFYDYDRLDADGKPRELNVEKAKENILIPFEPIQYQEIITQYGGLTERFMADNEDYIAWLYKVDGKGTTTRKKNWGGCFVIKGEGTVNGKKIKAGDSFLITNGCKELTFEGKDIEILACCG